MPVDLSLLLDTVANLARRAGLDPFQVVTAQSLAWYYVLRYEGSRLLPALHWARVAIRATRNGRDLPGCATSPSDALRHSWQWATMNEVRDGSPGPDVQAAHREQLELALAASPRKRRVAELRIAGASNREVAEELGVSPARTSQIAREIAEDFRR